MIRILFLLLVSLIVAKLTSWVHDVGLLLVVNFMMLVLVLLWYLLVVNVLLLLGVMMLTLMGRMVNLILTSVSVVALHCVCELTGISKVDSLGLDRRRMVLLASRERPSFL